MDKLFVFSFASQRLLRCARAFALRCVFSTWAALACSGCQMAWPILGYEALTPSNETTEPPKEAKGKAQGAAQSSAPQQKSALMSACEDVVNNVGEFFSSGYNQLAEFLGGDGDVTTQVTPVSADTKASA